MEYFESVPNLLRSFDGDLRDVVELKTVWHGGMWRDDLADVSEVSRNNPPADPDVILPRRRTLKRLAVDDMIDKIMTALQLHGNATLAQLSKRTHLSSSQINYALLRGRDSITTVSRQDRIATYGLVHSDL